MFLGQFLLSFRQNGILCQKHIRRHNASRLLNPDSVKHSTFHSHRNRICIRFRKDIELLINDQSNFYHQIVAEDCGRNVFNLLNCFYQLLQLSWTLSIDYCKAKEHTQGLKTEKTAETHGRFGHRL